MFVFRAILQRRRKRDIFCADLSVVGTFPDLLSTVVRLDEASEEEFFVPEVVIPLA